MMKSVLRVKVETHLHHIIPKYAGGTDDPDNLVELTIEDHAIAHLVRYKIYGDYRDKWAHQILSGSIDAVEFRSGWGRDTQKRLLAEGRHNWQKKNDAHTPEGRKRRSKRMMGNNYGSMRNITPEFRKKQADGARGNTNVRGTVWVVNDIGKRRRVKPDQIPEGYQRVEKTKTN
jgi:hypothetical protein